MKKYLFGFFVGLILITFIVLYFYFPQNQKLTQNLDKEQSDSQPTIHLPFSIKEAPSNSLKGKLKIISHEVKWQDRVATESSAINQDIFIQQGEAVETNEVGNANIIFDEVLEINVNEKTRLEIIQTLPQNLVFNIKHGSVSFNKIGNNIISIRSLHLLIQVEGQINFKVDDNIITLEVVKGNATIGYNNLNFETQSLVLNEDEKIMFNDTTRKVDPI